MTLFLLMLVPFAAARIIRADPAKKLIGLTACSLFMLLCGASSELVQQQEATVEAERIGEVLTMRAVKLCSHREGYDAYATQNRTELETIRKAQEQMLRAKNGDGPNVLRDRGDASLVAEVRSQ